RPSPATRRHARRRSWRTWPEAITARAARLPRTGSFAGHAARRDRHASRRRPSARRETKTRPAGGPAGPVANTPQRGARGGPSNGERAAAAAAARGVRVLEREAGAHHGGDVVDLHAIQVLAAERIHEEAQPVGLDDVVVFLRLVLDVQAVLEARAATGQNGHTQPGRFRRALLLHELPHLRNRRRCDREVHLSLRRRLRFGPRSDTRTSTRHESAG